MVEGFGGVTTHPSARWNRSRPRDRLDHAQNRWSVSLLGGFCRRQRVYRYACRHLLLRISPSTVDTYLRDNYAQNQWSVILVSMVFCRRDYCIACRHLLLLVNYTPSTVDTIYRRDVRVVVVIVSRVDIYYYLSIIHLVLSTLSIDATYVSSSLPFNTYIQPCITDVIDISFVYGA